MKTLADEVYCRLQDFCGLLSCFVLHSYGSCSTQAVPALALHGGVGRQSSYYYVLHKGSCQALELRACCTGASQCKKTGWRGAPPSFASKPQQSWIYLEKPLDMGLMFCPNIASLMVRLSQHFGASMVPNPNLEPVINPLLKHIIRNPYKNPQIPNVIHILTPSPTVNPIDAHGSLAPPRQF